MSDRGGAPDAGDAGAAGVVPSLAELVALRRHAQGTGSPRQGHHGLQGPAPSSLHGRGMEYAESREYVAGDDVRHMDWRLTARSGRAHTKLFQAERERLTLLVADTAPALYFGTRTRFKSVQAARVGAVTAWSAVAAGDRVAALRGGEPAIAPGGGARGAMRVLDALVRWYAHPPAVDAGLDAALEQARRLLRPGTRLVVLADPHAAAQVPVPRWRALARHREAILVLLHDPLEMAPPHGTLAFAGGRRRVLLALGRREVRQRWDAVFAAPLHTLMQELPGAGWRVRALSSDAPVRHGPWAWGGDGMPGATAMPAQAMRG